MTSDGKSLYDALKFYNTLSEELDRIYVYAYMKFHEDSTNQNIRNYRGKQTH